MTQRNVLRGLTAATLLLAAGAAGAHTGHGTHGLEQGLAHPLGADHLLAMLAVGLWSAVALEGARRWAGPLVFLAGLALGAAAGLLTGTVSGLEAAIALSVAGFGAMLAFPNRLRGDAGLALIAVAAVLHGLAHGAELPPGAGFAPYAAGFLATTAALHAVGLGLGRVLARAQLAVWRVAGALTGAAGLLLLSRA